MPIVRCFGHKVEAIAAAWRTEALTSLMWSQSGNPGEAGGQAQGFFVRCGEVTGFAKPSKQSNEPADAPPRAAHEKIASDLAFDLQLPIPPAILWRRQVASSDQETLCAISLVPFQPAHKWQHVEATPLARDRIAGMMSSSASSMSVFDTWVDNRDRANGGNLLVTEDLTTGSVHWAYIDYAYSLTYSWGKGTVPTVAGCCERYPVQTAVDHDAINRTVQAIEMLQEDTIRSIVNRLTPDFFDAAPGSVITDGLLRRRAGLRNALRQVYGGGL
jgi:hypothetical protein